MMTMIQNFQREYNRMIADQQKAVRLSIYQTLEITAEKSRDAIIADYPKRFKDENGIHKNKGIPKMTSKTKVDKNNLSITLNWGQKQNATFMDDNEFGGTRTGIHGRSKPMPSLELQQIGRTASGKMKNRYKVSKIMALAKKYENEYSKEHGTPKPFFMETKSGHHMIVRRKGKKRNPVLPLWHFDHKVKVRPRWGFSNTVEGMVIHTIDKTMIERLEKNLAKFDK